MCLIWFICFIFPCLYEYDLWQTACTLFIMIVYNLTIIYAHEELHSGSSSDVVDFLIGLCHLIGPFQENSADRDFVSFCAYFLQQVRHASPTCNKTVAEALIAHFVSSDTSCKTKEAMCCLMDSAIEELNFSSTPQSPYSPTSSYSETEDLLARCVCLPEIIDITTHMENQDETDLGTMFLTLIESPVGAFLTENCPLENHIEDTLRELVILVVRAVINETFNDSLITSITNDMITALADRICSYLRKSGETDTF